MKKEKNKFRWSVVLFVISFFVFRAIISNWDDFKAGLFGSFY